MSVNLTKDAVYARRKDVTRRSGWTVLAPGDVVTLCEKVQGRRRGDVVEPLVRICDVRIVSVRRERIDAITDEDVYREGFTDEDFMRDPENGATEYVDAITGERYPAGPWVPKWWFVGFYCSSMKRRPDDVVTRIEWSYDL